MNSFLALVHFYPVRDGRGEPPKKVITRKRFAGESIANSLRTDIDYRYSHGSVAKRISTEKVNSRSLGSIIEIRLILLMIFHERRKDFPFYPFLLSSSTLVRFILALSSMNLNRDFIYIYMYTFAVFVRFGRGRREGLTFLLPGRPWSPFERAETYLAIGPSERNTDQNHQGHENRGRQGASSLSSQGIPCSFLGIILISR